MAFHDTLGHRRRQALDGILTTLNDNQWHTHAELLTAALNHSDVSPKTASELIRKAWRAGLYRRTTTSRVARAQNALYRRPDPIEPSTPTPPLGGTR